MINPLLYEEQLVSQIQKDLLASNEFRVATAMVSVAGVDRLLSSPERCLKKGANGKLLIGIDLPSHPMAFQKLLKVSTKYQGQLGLKYFQPLKNRIFHPKLFLFARKNGITCAVIGSSNLTLGGLTENCEANVWIDDVSAIAKLTEYFDQNFDGAYSRTVTAEWINGYRVEWAEGQKLLAQVRKLRDEVRTATEKVADRSNSPKRIKDRKFAFTGGIPDWPRERVLYPYVKGLGGEIVRAETIAKADCLVQAERCTGEATRKLRGAAMFDVPVITEAGFWKIVRREKALNAKKGKSGMRARAATA